MADEILQEFALKIGLDAKDLTAGETVISSAILGIQRQLEGLVSKSNDTTKRVGENQKKTAGFFSGLNKTIQDGTKKTSDSIDSLKRNLFGLAAVGVSVGGAIHFINSMTNSVMNLGIQSQAIGISPQQLQGYQMAAQAAGSTSQAITGLLSRMSNATRGFQTMGIHSDAMFGAASAFGLNVDWNHDTGTQATQQILQQMQRMSPNRAYAFANMAGIDPSLVPSIMSGQLMRDQRSFAGRSNLTEQEQRNAAALNRQMVILNQQFMNVKNTIYTAMIPYVEQLLAYLNQWAIWLQNHPQQIKQALSAINDVITNMISLATKAANSVGGWNNAITILVGAAVGGKLLGLIAGITRSFVGMAGAIGGLSKIAVALLTNPIVMAALGLVLPTNNTPTTDGEFRATGVERWVPGSGMNINSSLSSVLNSKTFQGRIAPYKSLFSSLEAKYGLPPGMLSAIAAQESAGRSDAVSKSGALGMFQFMPGTGRQYGLSNSDLMNPSLAAGAAAKFLSHLNQKYHSNIVNIVRAYNWGEGNLDSYLKTGRGVNGQAMPDETLNYGYRFGASASVRGGTAPVSNHSSITIQNMTTNATSAQALQDDVSRQAGKRVAVMSGGNW